MRPLKEKPAQNYTVKESAELLDFLLRVAMPERSRTTVKQLLRDGYLGVNGERTSQFDRTLGVGDVVTLFPNPKPEDFKHRLLKIAYLDDHIVAVEKQAGISTVASGKDHKNTALRIVSDYLKHVEPGSMLFMLNRLDKDTTGVILFARNPEIQREIINNWRRIVPLQRFMAVAEGQPETDEGLLRGGEAREAKRGGRGTDKRKQTGVPEGIGAARYQVMKRGAFCCMMRIDLLKGRNPQIRKQLASLGMPLAGDHHHGSINKKLNAIALAGTRIEFIHPVSHERMVFDMPVPAIFNKLMRTPAPKTTKEDDNE